METKQPTFTPEIDTPEEQQQAVNLAISMTRMLGVRPHPKRPGYRMEVLGLTFLLQADSGKMTVTTKDGHILLSGSKHMGADLWVQPGNWFQRCVAATFPAYIVACKKHEEGKTPEYYADGGKYDLPDVVEVEKKPAAESDGKKEALVGASKENSEPKKDVAIKPDMSFAASLLKKP